MKIFYWLRFFVLLILFPVVVNFVTSVRASSNLNLCMIDYNYHNDNHPNADMAAIQETLPDILIDNTAHGLWGIEGGNGGSDNTIPSKYTPLGIQVYSYITAGDEGALNNSTIDGLSINLTRIDGIATDGATGVFLDQVTPTRLSAADKSYLSAIYNECQSQNLKLIINVGEPSFDYAYLSTVCDYIMTDEGYSGRQPTASETNMGLSKCIVVNNACSSQVNAVSYTESAWNYGFGWSWNTNSDQYRLPSYLNSYILAIGGDISTNINSTMITTPDTPIPSTTITTPDIPIPSTTTATPATSIITSVIVETTAIPTSTVPTNVSATPTSTNIINEATTSVTTMSDPPISSATMSTNSKKEKTILPLWSWWMVGILIIGIIVIWDVIISKQRN